MTTTNNISHRCNKLASTLPFVRPPHLLLFFVRGCFFRANSLFQPQNQDVGKKLGYATLFMVTLPLLAFFAVQHLAVLWGASSPDNWAGAAAILVTNVVVGGYCYSAYLEDLNDPTKKDSAMNDADAPRVGIYKQRVD
jgi:VMA21-like domain